MIKYLLFGGLFVLLVFLMLNYWDKTKDHKKSSHLIWFLSILAIVIGILAYLLYD